MTSPAELMKAMADIRGALMTLNSAEASMGLPPLDETNLSWPERVDELRFRLGWIGVHVSEHGRPDQRSLDALGAWVVSLKVALAREDELRVETGEAA